MNNYCLGYYNKNNCFVELVRSTKEELLSFVSEFESSKDMIEFLELDRAEVKSPIKVKKLSVQQNGGINYGSGNPMLCDVNKR